jgi:hypothetical protein
MKIVKNYGNDPESRLMMEIFDKVITTNYYKWPLERLEVIINDSERGDVWIEGNVAKLSLGKNNQFVKSRDRKGIETAILYRLNSLILKLQGMDFTDMREKYYSSERNIFNAILMLEEFIEKRRVAKRFPDMVFYSILREIGNSEFSGYSDFLRYGLSWTVFYGIDQWNMDFLRNSASLKITGIYDDSVFGAMQHVLDSKGDLDKDDVQRFAVLLGSLMEETHDISNQ